MTPAIPMPARARLADDTGSTLPLIVAGFAFAIVLVLVVTAASSLYLARKRLLTVADGAALAGAEAFDLDSVQIEAGRVRPQLDSQQVNEAVSGYLAAEPSVRADDIELVHAATPDGISAVVTVGLHWNLAPFGIAMPGGVPLEVTSTARSVFQ